MSQVAQLGLHATLRNIVHLRLTNICLLLEPKTAILGGPDIHLKEGSTMNLTCIITDSPEPPSYIFWRHDDAVSYLC